MNINNVLKKYQKVPVKEFPNTVVDNPLVSVCVQTYQHADYIKKCLNGIFMQKTDFPVEILLGEDESTDGTREICIDYAKQHPEKIRLFLHDRKNNIKIGGTSTGRFNILYNLDKFNGKYLAICEGDDYWIDPFKLQKQVEFLENNPEFSMSFHDVFVHWMDRSFPPSLFCPPDLPSVLSVEDIIKGWNIPTLSMVLRRDAILPLPEWFPGAYNGDLAIQLLAADKGKIKYFGEVMGVYRRSAGSLSYGIGRNPAFIAEQKLKLLDTFNRHTGFRHKETILQVEKKLKRDRRVANLKYRNRFTVAVFSMWNIFKKIIKCL